MKITKLKIELGEYDKIPFGYGLANVRYDCLTSEYYIIPINYIVKYFTHAWYWYIRLMHKDKLFRRLRQFYINGYNHGRKLEAEKNNALAMLQSHKNDREKALEVMRICNHIFEKIAISNGDNLQVMITKIEKVDDNNYGVEWAEIIKIPMKNDGSKTKNISKN